MVGIELIIKSSNLCDSLCGEFNEVPSRRKVRKKGG